MISKDQKPPPPTRDEIIRQLERLLSSPDFNATPQQIALLSYVVNRTLAGHAESIKGYTIATEAFGRRSDFDQSIDPIVSIQASRLRRALEQYYTTAGKNDPFRIDIPKGSYVPTFTEQTSGDSSIDPEPVAALDVMATWPSILVRPLANLTADEEDNYLAVGLTAELAHALSHYRELRVLEALHRDEASAPRNPDIDFIIAGSIRRDLQGATVRIRLEDAKKGIQMWSGKYQGDLEASQMMSFQEDVAAEVAVRVAGDNAIISKHIAGISRNKIATELTTYEAMLRFWESDTLLTPQTIVRAIRALRSAVAREPDNGQIWSMLAAQYADNFGLEIVDLPTPLDRAAEFAQKGVNLDPTNRRTRMILGYVRLLENKLTEARQEAEKAYDLCPNSLMFLDGIGWLIAHAGDWERGTSWVKKAIKLNPYYRPWTRYTLFLNWFRVDNYEKAHQETLYFTSPELYWDQIFRASVYGHLGKIEEGQACIRTLLSLKPDFAKRGRILIGRYIKFEDIADQLIQGLGKLGMNIES